MTDDSNPNTDATERMVYQIRLEGTLRHQWSAWFENAEIAQTASGDTLLTCTVTDQAALYGLLRKVRDLGIPLTSVVRIDTENTD